MFITSAAIKNVLNKNRNLLAGTIEELRKPNPDIYELTLAIEKAVSSLETMESLIDAKDTEADAGIRMKIPAATLVPGTLVRATNGELVPAFKDETEDDNPEQEDEDAKKAREESRGFFG